MPHNTTTTFLLTSIAVTLLILLGNAWDSWRSRPKPTHYKPLTELFSQVLSALEVAAVGVFFGGWCVALVLWVLTK